MAVEFAFLVLPLTTLLLGLFTAGSAFDKSISMASAVREGARFGVQTAQDSTWATKVQQRTAQVSDGLLAANGVCVELTKVGSGAVASSGCAGAAPSSPAGVASGTCVVKVWAKTAAPINIGIAQWNITLARHSVAQYAGSC